MVLSSDNRRTGSITIPNILGFGNHSFVCVGRRYRTETLLSAKGGCLEGKLLNSIKSGGKATTMAAGGLAPGRGLKTPGETWQSLLDVPNTLN